MKTFYLQRVMRSEHSTFGVLYGLNFMCFTMELPWKGNEPFESCIPTGEYICKRDWTGNHQFYRVVNVPNRTLIELHTATIVGDLAGCIALGETCGKVDGVWKLIESSPAMSRFMTHMNGDEVFRLVISNVSVETF